MKRALVLTLLICGAFALHAAEGITLGGIGEIQELRDGVAEIDRLEIARAVHESARMPAAEGTSDGVARYMFFPMSGINGKDIFLNNAVDLDPTVGIKDFDCTNFTYDGHRGHDMLLYSFRQQDIGTPVYAALDGTVIQVRDGEPDRNIVWSDDTRANYVVLRHSPTHVTYYYHLRKGSVAVVKDQTVTAGTQLGLAASSGFSNWPHLHFESIQGNAAYEPSAGPCRAGQSFWTQQPPLQRELYVRDFSFSPEAYDQYANFPEDAAPRIGTYVAGSTIYFRASLHNVPVQSNYVIRALRPDGSVASSFTGPFNNPTVRRFSFPWWFMTLELNPLGEWTIELSVNGKVMAVAPFRVVASGSQIENRAPQGVSVSLQPSQIYESDVARCEVETSLVNEDPDYDAMGYRFQWMIGDEIVREVTSAELMDVLPRGVLRKGDRVTCRVTPNDGALDGPSASAEKTVININRRRSVRR